MYETKHTPGPWVVEKAESSSTGSVHYAVKADYKPAEQAGMGLPSFGAK